MKKQLTKILSMMLVFVMVMCLVPPVEAMASSKPHYPINSTYRYYPKDKAANKTSHAFGNYNTNHKITNLKSSNKKVATISKNYRNNYTYLNVTTKRAGKTTISFSVKIGSKTYKYKSTITVTKYTPPLKSIKIGSTNLSSRFNKNDTHNLGGKKTYKGKINIKLNKNWKIVSINFFTANGKLKKLKNKDSVTLKKNCDLFVNCYNKKTNKWETVWIQNRTIY